MKIVRNPSLLTIGIAESISGIGDWITMLAVFTLLVFRGGGGVAQSSGVFLAGLLPTLLVSPLAGWLCDRFDRKSLMIASQVISGLVVSGLIFATRLELIYALLALQAVSMSIMTPARQSVVPQLVGREDLTRANAFLQQLAGMIKIGAPMLAGLVLTLLNPHTAILLDVLSFALAALILSRLPALPPQQPGSVTSSTSSINANSNNPAPSLPLPQAKYPVSSGGEGCAVGGQRRGEGKPTHPLHNFLSILRQLPRLRLLFLSIFLGIFVIVGFDVLAAVYFRDVLHESERFFGLAIGLVGVGTLAATLLLMLRKGAPSAWNDLVAGMGLLALIPLVLALVTYLPDMGLRSGLGLARGLVLAACLVGGMGNGLVNVQVSTLLQTLTPPAVLGQVGGLFQSTAVAGQLLGAVLTPLLVPLLLPMSAYFTLSTLALLSVVGYLIVQLMKPGPRALTANFTNKSE